MRKIIILLVLLAVASAAVLLLGGYTGEGDRAPRAEAGGYRPSDTTTWLSETFAAPFAPRLVVPEPPPWRLAAGATRRVAVPASDEQFRIARFHHLGGGAARIRYDCGNPPRGADAKTCREQVLCLGVPPAPQPSGCAAPMRAEGRLMILGSAGTLVLEAPGAEATLELR